jgi:hypothetical protein
MMQHVPTFCQVSLKQGKDLVSNAELPFKLPKLPFDLPKFDSPASSSAPPAPVNVFIDRR